MLHSGQGVKRGAQAQGRRCFGTSGGTSTRPCCSSSSALWWSNMEDAQLTLVRPEARACGHGEPPRCSGRAPGCAGAACAFCDGPGRQTRRRPRTGWPAVSKQSSSASWKSSIGGECEQTNLMLRTKSDLPRGGRAEPCAVEVEASEARAPDGLGGCGGAREQPNRRGRLASKARARQGMRGVGGAENISCRHQAACRVLGERDVRCGLQRV